MRETSLAAYDSLVASGALRGQLAAVARAVAAHGPGTATEILRAAGRDENINLARARLVELRERGVVAEQGIKLCAVTGKLATVYAFVGAYAIPRRRRLRAEWQRLALEALAELPDSERARELRVRALELQIIAGPRATAPSR